MPNDDPPESASNPGEINVAATMSLANATKIREVAKPSMTIHLDEKALHLCLKGDAPTKAVTIPANTVLFSAPYG